MKIRDNIYRYPTNSRRDGICRLRIFVNNKGRVIVVMTDLGEKNTSASVTNSIESICASLRNNYTIPPDSIFIEHNEPEMFHDHTFDLVTLSLVDETKWDSLTETYVIEFINCEISEFEELTLNNQRLLSEIEMIRTIIDPHVDFPYQEESAIILRRFEIEDNKISKKKINDLVTSNAGETEMQKLLRTDLSILGELYAKPNDDYICFSEFKIDSGFVDFVMFTGVSRMDVILIEIKGADFYLSNKGHYDKFNEKMETAITQIRNRLGFIHDNRAGFRDYVHRIRKDVESGSVIYNSFMGACKCLEVDSEKDINIYSVVIGGRTREDLKESRKRQDYEYSFTFPIKIESWDTFVKKLRRA